MRYDSEHKQKTRERVLKVAAREIRAEGPQRVGVASIMAKAGLTHGGFYSHFESKEALVAAAIGEMFASGSRRMVKETSDVEPVEGLFAYLDFYLSPAHRDAQAHGCPVVALAADAPRMSTGSRHAFADGAQCLRDRLAGLVRAAGHADAAALASSVMAEMVGALSLARIEPDAALSDAILADSLRSLKQRLQPARAVMEPKP